MKRLISYFLSLLLLVACEMQSVQYKTLPAVTPKFVGDSRFNEETGQYEVQVKWQGLGDVSYEIHRKTIESDPYNYGGGGIRVTSTERIHTTGPSDTGFIDRKDITERLFYEYELLDSETRTFKVGPIRVYVFPDPVVTGSLTDDFQDNRYGTVTFRGAVKIANWRDVSAKRLVFQENASLVFGYHPPPAIWESVPPKDSCIVRKIFAERAEGEVVLTGIDDTCVADGKTYQGNSFFIQITEESPVKFIYGKGVGSQNPPAYLQCILVGQRKVLWSERCEKLLPPKKNN